MQENFFRGGNFAAWNGDGALVVSSNRHLGMSAGGDLLLIMQFL